MVHMWCIATKSILNCLKVCSIRRYKNKLLYRFPLFRSEEGESPPARHLPTKEEKETPEIRPRRLVTTEPFSTKRGRVSEGVTGNDLSLNDDVSRAPPLKTAKTPFRPRRRPPRANLPARNEARGKTYSAEISRVYPSKLSGNEVANFVSMSASYCARFRTVHTRQR